MIRMRLVSDIHEEFKDAPMHIPSMDTDSETILIVAGDIDTKGRGLYKSRTYKNGEECRIIEKLSKQFYKVVFVLGNHDYWGYDMGQLPTKIEQYIADNNLDNVIFLNDSFVEIDGVIFVGGTLWTDYGRSPTSMHQAQTSMNDFRKIRFNNKKIVPAELLALHDATKSYIQRIARENSDKPIVVVSHHAPQFMSIPPHLRSGMSATWYASDLSELILNHPNIVYWMHGHTHFSSKYSIGQCTVMCNPFGYWMSKSSKEETGFEPYKLIRFNQHKWCCVDGS